MIPGSFDKVTAREVIGDGFSRIIEEKARQDADSETFNPPTIVEGTYWEQVQNEMRFTIYIEQYMKRLERNARKIEPRSKQ